MKQEDTDDNSPARVDTAVENENKSYGNKSSAEFNMNRAIDRKHVSYRPGNAIFSKSLT